MIKNRRQLRALLILIAFVLLAVVGNIGLTAYFYSGDAFASYAFFVALGLLVAQPCLASIWCALGSERGLVRIPAAMGILFALLAVYLKTLRVLDNNLPLEVFSIIGGVVLTTTVILQVPLWIFRGVSKQTILLPSASETELAHSQFGIKHLLITMTIAAVVVAIAQASVPESEASRIAWGSLTLLLLFFVITACLLSFLALAAVFSRHKRWVFLTLLGIFLLVCPYGSAAFMENSNSFRMSMGIQEIFNMYVFIGSIAAGVISVLLVFYLIGYRLEKRSSNT